MTFICLLSIHYQTDCFLAPTRPLLSLRIFVSQMFESNINVPNIGARFFAENRSCQKRREAGCSEVEENKSGKQLQSYAKSKMFDNQCSVSIQSIHVAAVCAHNEDICYKFWANKRVHPFGYASICSIQVLLSIGKLSLINLNIHLRNTCTRTQRIHSAAMQKFFSS